MALEFFPGGVGVGRQERWVVQCPVTGLARVVSDSTVGPCSAGRPTENLRSCVPSHGFVGVNVQKLFGLGVGNCEVEASRAVEGVMAGGDLDISSLMCALAEVHRSGLGHQVWPTKDMPFSFHVPNRDR